MSKNTNKIATDELSIDETQGIERVLEDRQLAVVELGQGELDSVSGGLSGSTSTGGGTKVDN